MDQKNSHLYSSSINRNLAESDASSSQNILGYNFVKAARDLYSWKKEAVGYLPKPQAMQYVKLLDNLFDFFSDTKEYTGRIRNDVLVLKKILSPDVTLKKMTKSEIDDLCTKSFEGMSGWLRTCIENGRILLADVNEMFILIGSIKHNEEKNEQIDMIKNALEWVAAGVSISLSAIIDAMVDVSAPIKATITVAGAAMPIVKVIKKKLSETAKELNELNFQKLDSMLDDLSVFSTQLKEVNKTAEYTQAYLKPYHIDEALGRLCHLIKLCEKGRESVSSARKNTDIPVEHSLLTKSNGIKH